MKVPAGEFAAVRVDWEYGPGWKATHRYAHGVGLVRLDAGGTTTMALNSFTPGKD